MLHDFKIRAIDPKQFDHLFAMNEQALQKMNALKMIADAKPGYQCRVSLEDAEVGEEVILIHHQHHAVDSPYQASGPVFVRKQAAESDLPNNEIPDMLLHRLLSLRVYNNKAMMVDQGTTTVKGTALKTAIQNAFQNPEAAYIHIHNSSHGCYVCQVDRLH